MKYNSVFDIIGPVMIGPSSSHTAGAARIGKAARNFFGHEPSYARIHLYGSFAKTYKGHGTDFALVGGLLGFETDDLRMSKALDIANDQGFKVEFIEDTEEAEHPNTARLIVGNHEHKEVEVTGISIGGGKIEITNLNGFDVRLSDNYPVMAALFEDRFNATTAVKSTLADYQINVRQIDTIQKKGSQKALMTVEVNKPVEQSVIDLLKENEHIIHVSNVIS